ncbi:hypothetical protein DFH06DRAFT_1136606 [Mycena polygramma]|nr:hypothetical protein DFH06DRAFT_1136606 [Mycena polygramma]
MATRKNLTITISHTLLSPPRPRNGFRMSLSNFALPHCPGHVLTENNFKFQKAIVERLNQVRTRCQLERPVMPGSLIERLPPLQSGEAKADADDRKAGRLKAPKDIRPIQRSRRESERASGGDRRVARLNLKLKFRRIIIHVEPDRLKNISIAGTGRKHAYHANGQTFTQFLVQQAGRSDHPTWKRIRVLDSPAVYSRKQSLLTAPEWGLSLPAPAPLNACIRLSVLPLQV